MFVYFFVLGLLRVWVRRECDIITTEDFFRVYIASSKHEGRWENSRQFYNLKRQSTVCLAFENTTQAPECLDKAMFTKKKSLIAFTKKGKQIEWRYNRVYSISPRHTYISTSESAYFLQCFIIMEGHWLLLTNIETSVSNIVSMSCITFIKNTRDVLTEALHCVLGQDT